MNYSHAPGGALALKPMWHPPVPMEFTFLFAVAAFDAGYTVAPFAILFFLLIIWITRERKEGFQVAGTVDWVQNSSRWFSEVVLKEKPKGIREKDVNTYPVQGDDSIPSK